MALSPFARGQSDRRSATAFAAAIFRHRAWGSNRRNGL